MKRILILLIILLNISLVFGADLDITLQKQDYASLETVVAEINVNVDLLDDLSVSNLRLFDNSGNRIPVPMEFFKIDNKYLVSFNLPSLDNGNYSLEIVDVTYVKNDNLFKETFSSKIQIIKKEDVISVFPGIIYLNLGDLDQPTLNFKIKNNGVNSLNVNYSIVGDFLLLSRENDKLNSGSEKSLKVATRVRNINNNLFVGEFIVQYSEEIKIPIYLIKSGAIDLLPKNETVVEVPDIVLSFIEEEVDKSLKQNRTAEGSLNFKNYADFDLHNLTFTLKGGLDEIIDLNYLNLDVLEAGVQKSVDVLVNKNMFLSKNYVGELLIESNEGYTASIPIKINFIEEEIVKEIPKTQPIVVEDVVVENKKSNLRIIVGLFVTLLIIALIGFYFFKKSQFVEEDEFAEVIRKVGLK